MSYWQIMYLHQKEWSTVSNKINAVSKMVLAKRSKKPVSQLFKIHAANLKKNILDFMSDLVNVDTAVICFLLIVTVPALNHE